MLCNYHNVVIVNKFNKIILVCSEHPPQPNPRYAPVCSSNPVLNTFRKTCKKCGCADSCCIDKSMTSPSLTIQDEIFANLTSVD